MVYSSKTLHFRAPSVSIVEEYRHEQARCPPGFSLKPHIEVRFKWRWFPTGIFSKSKFLAQGELKKEVWYCFVKKFTVAAVPALWQRDFDIVVTVFAVGEIKGDAVDSPRFVAFEGSSREDSSSSFNLGRLMKESWRKQRSWWERSTISPV